MSEGQQESPPAAVIGVVAESSPGETRVAGDSGDRRQLIELGYDVVVESGAGAKASFTDEAYTEAGAAIAPADDAWRSDIVLKVNPPTTDEIATLARRRDAGRPASPRAQPGPGRALAPRPITALAMDAVPRISRAQSLDVLSSMANIAGYRAVIEAAHAFGRFFTGQVTAAGKVPPAKVLVAGAGVAGLAAIGAASSMGAIVRATDPRPEVADQVKSLGGEYLPVDVEAEQTAPTATPRRPRGVRPPGRRDLLRAGRRRRHHHHHRADPGPSGAEADHRRGRRAA